MATKKIERDVKKLQKMFPRIEGIQPGEDWGSSKDSIHLGNAGEGGTVYNERYDDYFPAADYFDPFPSWEGTVNPILEMELVKMGYFVDWYDAGTLIAYLDI